MPPQPGGQDKPKAGPRDSKMTLALCRNCILGLADELLVLAKCLPTNTMLKLTPLLRETRGELSPGSRTHTVIFAVLPP